MTTNERLKQIRYLSRLTMAKFGKRIGYSCTAVSQIERGEPPYKAHVPDRYIKLVAHEFGVRELWIRKGKGPMYEIAPAKPADAAKETKKEETKKVQPPVVKQEERKDDSSVSIAVDGVNIAIEQCFKLALSLMSKTDKECLCKLAWAVLIACDQEEGVKK